MQIECPVCFSSQWSEGPFETIACNSCNLIRKANFNVKAPDFGGPPDTSSPNIYRARLDNIEPFIRPGQSVLEIGCRSGSFLAMLHDQDKTLDLSGIDPNGQTIAMAMEKVKAKYQFKTLEDADLETYDLILSTGVFYRHANPHAMIEKMGQGLNPGGHLYLEMGMITDDKEDDDEGWYVHAHPILYWYSTAHIIDLFGAQHRLNLVDSGWITPWQPIKPPRFWWGMFCK